MRAALYARFSTDMQSVASIPDQFAVCRALADRLGASVVREYSDAAISAASTANRLGLLELLDDAEAGRFDVVICEALDRLSRSQADVATLFEDLRFLGVRIVTVSEGEVDELHIGLKGTMNALQLREIGRKTRRGLAGVARSGRSAGGLCYGYRVRKAYDAAGEPIRGLREIDEAQAQVVRRIFADYAGGLSPRAIAAALNAEGVPGPRGGLWNTSTINGNAARGNGILHNALYRGEAVWGRNTWSKDRRTGKRRSRVGGEAERVTAPAEDLRIVEQTLWDRVQAQIAANAVGPSVRPEDRRRPVHMLSGLVRCAACGGGPMVISGPGGRLRCSVNREKGPAVCPSGRTALSIDIERRTMAAIRDILLDPALIEEAVRELHAEQERRRREKMKSRAGIERELADVAARAGRLVDQIADGLVTGPAVREKLQQLESRRADLEGQLASAPPVNAPVRLPSAAAQYRKWVEDLQAGLAGDATQERREAQQALRGLIKAIHFTPGPRRGDYSLEVETEMAPLLSQEGQSVVSTVGAGTGFEPVTFRL